MAKIEDSKVKQQSGGYERIFGNDELGKLMSKIQSTSIRAGNELENIIAEIVAKDNRLIENADDVITTKLTDNAYLISKKAVKKSVNFRTAGLEPDFLVCLIDNENKHCYIVELKDGDNFDTKKSKAERQNLIDFKTNIADKIQYSFSIHFCCFNQTDKEKIVEGFKRVITTDEAMTGREFCELLKIDYDKIVKSRKKDQKQNMEYFVREILKIKELKKIIIKELESEN
jgi:hypothetical protein